MVHSRPATDRDMGYDDLKTKVSTLEIKLQQFGKSKSQKFHFFRIFQSRNAFSISYGIPNVDDIRLSENKRVLFSLSNDKTNSSRC